MLLLNRINRTIKLTNELVYDRYVGAILARMLFQRLKPTPPKGSSRLIFCKFSRGRRWSTNRVDVPAKFGVSATASARRGRKGSATAHHDSESPGSGLVVPMAVIIACIAIAMIMRVAMAGVIMAMIVTMAVMLPVTVIVAVMVLMTMIMVVTMGMIMPVRAAIIGLERRHHRGRLEAAFVEQQRSRGVREHAQAIGEDLDGNVAIAQCQQQACRPGEILLADLQHRLGIGHHLDEMAVVEHQAIIGAEQRRDQKIELDAGALAAEHEPMLLGAVGEFEQQRVDDFAGAGVAGAYDFLGAGHRVIRIQWRVGRSLSPPPAPNGTTDGGRSGLAPASTVTAGSAPASRRAYSR
jgi:hypothetical protein